MVRLSITIIHIFSNNRYCFTLLLLGFLTGDEVTEIMRNKGTIQIFDRGGEMVGIKERMMMDYVRPQGTVLVVFYGSQFLKLLKCLSIDFK